MDHLTDAQRRALVHLAADRPGPPCRTATLRALVRRGLVRNADHGPVLTDEGRAVATALADEDEAVPNDRRTPVEAPTTRPETWVLRDSRGTTLVRVKASGPDEARARVALVAPHLAALITSAEKAI